MGTSDIDLERNPAQRLLVAVEAGRNWQPVVGGAARLAQRTQAEVIVVSVAERASARRFSWDVQPLEDVDEEVSHAIYQLHRLGVRARGVVARARLGRVAEEIVAAALKYRADAIVVGTAARSRLASLLMSSVAPRVLRLSPLPVVTVRTRRSRRDLAHSSRGAGHVQPAL